MHSLATFAAFTFVSFSSLFEGRTKKCGSGKIVEHVWDLCFFSQAFVAGCGTGGKSSDHFFPSRAVPVESFVWVWGIFWGVLFYVEKILLLMSFINLLSISSPLSNNHRRLETIPLYEDINV